MFHLLHCVHKTGRHCVPGGGPAALGLLLVLLFSYLLGGLKSLGEVDHYGGAEKIGR